MRRSLRVDRRSCTICVQERRSRALIAARAALVHEPERSRAGKRRPGARSTWRIDISRVAPRAEVDSPRMPWRNDTGARRAGREPDSPCAAVSGRPWRQRARPRLPTPHRCSSWPELPPARPQRRDLRRRSAPAALLRELQRLIACRHERALPHPAAPTARRTGAKRYRWHVRACGWRSGADPGVSSACARVWSQPSRLPPAVATGVRVEHTTGERRSSTAAARLGMDNHPLPQDVCP